MDDIKVKQEIVEKIKSSSNILITVSNDPSVDELSAALGLTLVLDKMEKYATAVFSGATPPAIAFLEPEKTFENNTDSLRDFIIALNKEKADHLRFKPDGDYVKIFITPYKTVIKPEDLEFSQGDYNVELVIALGVNKKDNLDAALNSHGQILHDATVVTVTAGDVDSSLGSIDWHDGSVSSISEMITTLIEALKDDKKTPLIDGPVATALLTGIVAQTDRFSNSHTTSKVMTIAANLMAAGADQQLIAFKLQQPSEASDKDPDLAPAPVTESEEPTSAYGLDVSHDTPDTPDTPNTPPEDAGATATSAYALDNTDATITDTATAEAPQVSAPTEEPKQESPVAAPAEEVGPSRAYIVEEPTAAYSFNHDTDNSAQEQSDATKVAPGSVAVSAVDVSDENGSLIHSAYAPEPTDLPPTLPEPAVVSPEPTVVQPEPATPTPAPTVAPSVAPETSPVPPAPVAPAAPADLGLPMPPPLPDFSSAAPPPPPPAIPLPPTEQPAILGDILAPEPATAGVPAPASTPTPAVSDPTQFQIPTQG